MTGILEDLRFGLRGLAKNRGFALVAVLSLALGIGANTTIFTLLNAVFLRPLPVRDASSLVAIFTTDQRNPGLLPCSYPNYRDYRDHNSVFSSLLLYTSVTVNLTGRGDPQLLMAQLVSGNYFDSLGVEPGGGPRIPARGGRQPRRRRRRRHQPRPMDAPVRGPARTSLGAPSKSTAGRTALLG